MPEYDLAQVRESIENESQFINDIKEAIFKEIFETVISEVDDDSKKRVSDSVFIKRFEQLVSEKVDKEHWNEMTKMFNHRLRAWIDEFDKQK